MESRTDEELIRAYLDGNEKAFEALTGRYIKPIYWFVFRYIQNVGDAEDITQDIFLSVWKNIKKFDTTKKFKTWLFTIAKNASVNWIKKKKALPFSDIIADNELQIEDTIEDAEPLPEELFVRANLKKELETAVAGLNPAYQTTIFLHYKEGLTFQEIADINGESLNTVKSRHLRALVTLKGVLHF